MEPDRDLRMQPLDQPKGDPALGLGQRGWPGIEEATEWTPAPGEIAVQINAMRVPARASDQPIRVDHWDDPEIDAGRRGLLELPRDRDACSFVSVDAADHEFALATIRVSNLIGNNRSTLNRVA